MVNNVCNFYINAKLKSVGFTEVKYIMKKKFTQVGTFENEYTQSVFVLFLRLKPYTTFHINNT